MAIETAGKKPTKTQGLKIENEATIDLPKKADEQIQSIIAYLPIEHRMGLEKLKLVDFISNPQLKKMDVPVQGDLPGLYHPKMQNRSAWMEVSVGALLQPTEGFLKRWMAKTSFKSNLAGLIFSLVGQHYYMTLRHSVKKGNLEPQIKQYAQKNLRQWSEKQSENSIRGKIFKPLRPMMERWAKWLNKKAAQNK
ncbi:MAG: hypothetical protein HKN25_01275 [Pyrinomonadaceae bacterium]|nr:hypothetical protein [Pyrinomonadaceae bacterium]